MTAHRVGLEPLPGGGARCLALRAGIQPRTLDVLRPFGIAEELAHRGNRAMRLRFHARVRAADVQLFDIGMDDTAYPGCLGGGHDLSAANGYLSRWLTSWHGS